MRWGLICSICVITLFLVTGCEAVFQGTRCQIENTFDMPSRVTQGTKTIPAAIPTPKSTIRGLHGTEQLKAIEEGSVKQIENITAGNETLSINGSHKM